MKEGFWKKVLVGVAASLITLSAVSLVSSIAQRVRPEEKEESAVTCTHTKIIEVSGVAPTCKDSGLTDGIFCGVCHGVIKAQQVIDPLGHIPVDVPGYPATCVATGLTDGQTCGVCEAVVVKQTTIPKSNNHTYENATCVECGCWDTTVCVEVKVEVGELVAGNWYRMYRGNSMTLSGEISNALYENRLTLFAGKKGDPMESQTNFVSCMGWNNGQVLKETNYVITEDYIDVCLAPLIYNGVSGYGTYEITAETTIESISGTIYKLVLPGSETNEESSS